MTQTDTHDHAAIDRSPCVFLGAGASACAGYRPFLALPRLFFTTARQASELQAPANENFLLKSIKEQMLSTARRETLDNYLWALDHYCHWARTAVSRADLKKRFAGDTTFVARAVDLRDTVNHLRRRIAALSIRHYASSPLNGTRDVLNRLISFYSQIAGRSDGLQLFTTNYDLLPEFLFSKQEHFSEWREQAGINSVELAFENGFPAFEQAGGLPTMTETSPAALCWDGDAGYSRTPHQGLVQIHRLHGCVGWYRYEADGRTEVRFLLPAAASLQDIGMSDFDKRLCVMYPGREEAIGIDPHGPGFRRFAETCREKGRVLFIGFSFSDDDVVVAAFSALERLPDEQRRLFIVDATLTEDDVANRIRDVASRSSVPLWLPRSEDIRLRREWFPPQDLTDLFQWLAQ
jgi:hypothetical protein